jgi:class 3 adenylate cyclase/pimeloyl-ACP methyl ester carboxylesterase
MPLAGDWPLIARNGRIDVVERPQTQYVEVGDAEVGYQVYGAGPIDLLWCFGLGSNVDHQMDIAPVADFLRGVGSFSRLIVFDRRGTGVSDAISSGSIPTWEEWAEDMGTVLDAVGSTQAAILASLDAGPMAILYAVSHPDRVKALILHNTAARYLAADDYPVGATAEVIDSLVQLTRSTWGTAALIDLAFPGAAGDPQVREALARSQRVSATPRAAAAQYAFMLHEMDVRAVLPLVRIPTLVLHVRESPMVPIEYGQYLAEHIDGAKLVELPGADMFPTSEVHTMVEEIGEFLTGSRPVTEVDRVLASVLFTDIVDSTQRAASLGDQRWRSLLDRHDAVTRDQLRRFHGREVNTTGDGFIASFDGPARAIRCARAISDAVTALGIDLHIGLHTGECEVRGDDLGGLAVHIAARLGKLASPGEVLVSSTVKDLVVGSGIKFADRGQHQLKGVPGLWRLFAVTAPSI